MRVFKSHLIIILLLIYFWSALTIESTDYTNNLLLKTKLILRQQQQQQQQPSRCLNLCQNDQYCKSGQCILTECSDTIACYKYCMLCNSQLNCYETGEFCSYNSGRKKTNTNFSLIIFLLTILIIY